MPWDVMESTSNQFSYLCAPELHSGKLTTAANFLYNIWPFVEYPPYKG